MALSKRQKAAAVVGGVATVAVVAFLLIPKAQAASQVTSITLGASPTSGNVPLTVTFSGTALTGTQPAAGATLYFFVDGQLQTGQIVTASDGTFSFQYIFNVAGTYECVVSNSSVLTQNVVQAYRGLTVG